MQVLSVPQIPAQSEVLLDANIIVYGLLKTSAQCVQLFERLKRRELAGFVTVEILSDVCHRLMLAEAAARGLIVRPNASSLQGKPNAVRSLADYWTRLTLAKDYFAVLPFDDYRHVRAHPLRLAYGLMTNDSLLLAASDLFGISHLATNDADFDAVSWLTIYKPTDLIAPSTAR